MKHINKIKNLQFDAGCHGDEDMVIICQKAIEGDQDSYDECMRIMKENTKRLLEDLSNN